MMKVSDPIIFGHAVRAFFAGVFTEHGDALERRREPEQRPRRSILTAIDELPHDEREAIEAAIEHDLRDRRRRSRWSTPTAGSRTCTSRAT